MVFIHEEVVLENDEPRPDGSDRYAIYYVVKTGLAQHERHRIAETNARSVIGSIETLLDEDEIPRGASIGVLDRQKPRRWVINPWA